MQLALEAWSPQGEFIMNEPCFLIPPLFPGLQKSSLCRETGFFVLSSPSYLELEGSGLGGAFSVSVWRRPGVGGPPLPGFAHVAWAAAYKLALGFSSPSIPK